MATNYESVVSVLAAHREARRWSDEAVAADLCARLGIDPAGEVVAGPQPVATVEPAAPNGGQDAPHE